MSSSRSKKTGRGPRAAADAKTPRPRAAAKPASSTPAGTAKRAKSPAPAKSAARHAPGSPAEAPALPPARDGVTLEFLPARPSSGPRTGPRHAVFIDVENTSSEIDLVRVLEDLRVDPAMTELTAVGNWRVVGQQLGRMLAQRGAHLVHSAPAPRVPDWSDLWIAVTAGMWLGRAAPGDSLHILSDDRAFDAVGDAAARLGVAFRRITYRATAGGAERAAASAEVGAAGGRRRRRRRRGEAGAARIEGGGAGRAERSAHPSPAPAGAVAGTDEERHAASLDQVRAVIARLTAADPVRGVSLDTLTVALKAEGFQRPPGSPRLVTRLRRIKDVELLSNGRVRLTGPTAEVVSAAFEGSYEPTPAETAEATQNGVPEAEPAPETAAAAPGAGKRRSRRRGGRRRGGRRHAETAATPDGGA